MGFRKQIRGVYGWQAFISEFGYQTGQRVIRLSTASTMVVLKGGRRERQTWEERGNEDSRDANRDINAQCRRGRLIEALDRLDLMDQQGVQADTRMYASLLQGCIDTKALAEGKRVHAHILNSDFRRDIFLRNNIVSMYAKCGSIICARQLFDKMPERNVVSWNVMIAASAQHRKVEEALKLFWQMQKEGFKPNKVTFISVLNACGSPTYLAAGKLVHSCIVDSGMELDVIVGTALVNMYNKCSSIYDASQVFNKLPNQDVVSWTAMIAGYAQHGHGEEALRLFWQMQNDGLKPNKVTFTGALNACGSLADLAEGKLIHAVIINSRIDLDVIVETSLMTMYSKCANMEEALNIFKRMRKRDVVSWNAMIAGCAQQGLGEKALKLFQQMQKEGEKPNQFALSSALSACAGLAALAEGKHLHFLSIKTGLDSDFIVENALIDMYAKCGSVEDARKIFDKMQTRNVISWTAMIAGCALHGRGKEAIQLFQQMQQEGVKPNEFTFSSVLTACNHVGLIDEGCYYFHSMSRDYGITPTMEHYGALVDLLGRAGRLGEAEGLINKMLIQPNAVLWLSLLGACRNHGNVELGEHAAEHVLKLEPQNAAAYVLLGRIYAATGKWDYQGNVRKSTKERGVTKEPGHSWIEVKNTVHTFVARDKSHEQLRDI